MIIFKAFQGLENFYIKYQDSILLRDLYELYMGFPALTTTREHFAVRVLCLGLLMSANPRDRASGSGPEILKRRQMRPRTR